MRPAFRRGDDMVNNCTQHPGFIMYYSAFCVGAASTYRDTFSTGPFPAITFTASTGIRSCPFTICIHSFCAICCIPTGGLLTPTFDTSAVPEALCNVSAFTGPSSEVQTVCVNYVHLLSLLILLRKVKFFLTSHCAHISDRAPILVPVWEPAPGGIWVGFMLSALCQVAPCYVFIGLQRARAARGYVRTLIGYALPAMFTIRPADCKVRSARAVCAFKRSAQRVTNCALLVAVCYELITRGFYCLRTQRAALPQLGHTYRHVQSVVGRAIPQSSTTRNSCEAIYLILLCLLRPLSAHSTGWALSQLHRP